YEERALLYCSAGHPLFDRASKVKIGDLAGTPAVAPSYRMSPEALGLHRDLDCVAKATDREAIAFLILTGEYIGFLPDHYAASWVEKGQMTAILPEKMSYLMSIAAATRRGRRHNRIVECFLEELL